LSKSYGKPKNVLEAYLPCPYKCDIIVPDDYDTIQEAIDAANQSDCIYVRSGTFYENITIEGNTKNGLILCGENRNTTIIDAGNKNGTCTATIKNTDDVTITGFTITGSGLDYYRKGYLMSGIYCVQANDAYIHNNTIQNNGNGINGDSYSKVIIDNNLIIDNLGNGIMSKAVNYIYNNSIVHNGFGNDPKIMNGDGIEIQNSAGASCVCYNHIKDNRVDGIWDETIDNHEIIGNTIEGNGQYGIHIQEGRNCKISNNCIHSNGDKNVFQNYGGGIWLYQSTYNIINNNTIYENMRGIHITESHWNDVMNNIIHHNDKAGLEFGQTSSNVVSYNDIYYNDIGIFVVYASRFGIIYNDIYFNDKYGLLTIWGSGDAKMNWWGRGIWGPYSAGQMLRIPCTVIVSPWSTERNTLPS